VLLDFDYLQAKLIATGPNALIADYDYLPEDEDLRLVQSAIRLSANVLARDSRQLAGQMVGRLLGNRIPSIEFLLKQAAGVKAWPWLRPLNPSLTTAGGPLLRTLEGHTDWVDAVAVTPDGRRAVSASREPTLRLWDLSTGQTILTLEGHRGSVTAVAVTSDGRAVSASWDRTLRLWDLSSGQTILTLEGHTDWVDAVAVTPDGRRAVSASRDHTLRLWDLVSGKEIATFTGESLLISCAVAPDGRTIVAGDTIGRTHLLRLVAGDETKRSISEIKTRLLHRKEQVGPVTDFP
jgi:WD40 repeat protein